MKLRNKKTGEIAEVSSCYSARGEIRIYYYYEEKAGQIGTCDSFSSLAELAEEWEDYAPAEPLIKDEKTRKAVRAWAEANNGLEKLLIIKIAGRLEISDGSPHLIYISFHADNETLKRLDDRTYYTIAELCGKEKE